jgi:hypothetical protein
MRNKTHKSCRTDTSNKNHDQLKQSTSNNDYRNSNLTIYHQNMWGINNKIDELVKQWGFKIPHLILPYWTSSKQYWVKVCKFGSYNLGGYFCRKSWKNGGVSIFVHETLQYTNSVLT